MGSYDCCVVFPGCSRIHVCRPARSGTARIPVRTVLRGSRGCRSCLLARVGRVPAGARCAAAAARAVEPAHRRWRRTSAGSSRGCSTSIAPATAIAEATRDQDDLFRFKVDFVRRRALPLLKGGVHVAPTPEDDAIVEALHRGRVDQRSRAGDRPGRMRAAGSRRKRIPRSRIPNPGSRSAEALVRRAGPRSGLPRLGDLPLSGERRALAARGGRAPRAAAARGDGRPRVAAAPARRLQADRRAHEAARGAERDSLLRPVPRARQGLLLEGAPRQGRQDRRQPARHRARRLPARREDLRDARAAQGRRRRSARSRSSCSTTRCARAPATASATTA